MGRKTHIMNALLAGTLCLAGCAEDESGLVIAAHAPWIAEVEEEEGAVTAVKCAVQDEFGGKVSAISMVVNLDDLAKREVLLPGRAFPIQQDFLVNVDVQNSLAPSTGYKQLGESAELRVENNQAELRSISFSFESEDNTFDLSSLDKEIPVTRVVYPGSIFHSSVAFIDTATSEVQAWRDLIGGLTQNDPNAIVPAIVTIQVSGVLQGGEEIVSNKIKLPLEICDQCQKSTTPFCLEAAD